MTDVRLTWELPNVGSRQRPIQSTKISFRVDASLPWTVQEMVLAPETELLFQDVPSGTIFYQAIAVDDLGQESTPVETSVDIAFDPPGAVANFQATVV